MTDFSDITSQELINELKERSDIRLIDTDDLVEALTDKTNVDAVEVPRYREYVVSVENGKLLHGTGPKKILVIPD